MKQRYKIKANAKINLGLNVLSKREDGYHEIDMMMMPISLYDSLGIQVYPYSGSLSIFCKNKTIPRDHKNIIYKVYESFYRATSLESKRIKVFLKKEIPSEAGLGGGSSDGAFFLRFLNRLHKFPLSFEEEIRLAASIGADLPFFLNNQMARVQGIGEKISYFSFPITWKVLLIKPSFGCSTADVYAWSDELSNPKYSNLEKIISKLASQSYENLEEEIQNTLEQALLLKDKKVLALKRRIQTLTHKKSFLTGSGSSYCILVHPKEARKLQKICQKHFQDCQIKLCSFL